MRIAVVGAGAIGGAIAHALAAAGLDPLLVARGESARTIARDGLRVRRGGKEETSRPRVVEATDGLGPVDAVIGTAKAHDWPALCASLRPLVGPATALVPAINGIPWWYFQGIGGPFADARIACLDPHGVLAAAFAPENIVGCAVYMAAERTAPGAIDWSTGRRLVLGRVRADRGPDVGALAAALRAGGMEIEESADIRRDVWLKLLGNAGFNSVGALTASTVVEILDDPDLRATCADTIRELVAVAAAAGTPIEIDAQARLEAARRLGAFRTSTLQDFAAGRPLEIAALLDAPCEIGRLVGVPTPVLSTLARLLRNAVARRDRA